MTTFEKFIEEDQLPQQKEKKIGSYLIGITLITQKRLLEKGPSGR